MKVNLIGRRKEGAGFIVKYRAEESFSRSQLGKFGGAGILSHDLICFMEPQLAQPSADLVRSYNGVNSVVERAESMLSLLQVCYCGSI